MGGRGSWGRERELGEGGGFWGALVTYWDYTTEFCIFSLISGEETTFLCFRVMQFVNCILITLQ